MKNIHAWSVYLGLGLIGVITSLSAAENIESKVEEVTSRGAHHRTIKNITRTLLADGSETEQSSQVVELATGLHYRSGEEWLETQELIEPAANGAVAHKGPHKAAFAANLNTAGAIQLMDENGELFRSHILGLAYTDAATGQSTLIAAIKDSFGKILPPNQMVYEDAFTDIKADVRYTYMRHGFEQDIIIRESLPSPASYGFDPATTRLEVFTEFLSAPGGVAQARVLSTESDPFQRAAMVLPDFIDEDLHFGSLKTGEGKAIDFQGVVPHDIPVGKTFEVREGRTFLIEAVQFGTVEPALQALPQRRAQATTTPTTDRAAIPVRGKAARNFPAPPRKEAALDRKPAQLMASLNTKSGLLLDYVFTMTSGLTNFAFRPEATHTVSGTINLYGTSTLHGGTVIKYSRGGVLNLNGTVVCETTPYHPAVFTAVDDTTLGENTKTKSLSGYYAAAALRATTNVAGELHDLRISYAELGLDWKGSTDRFYNLQFINCSNAVKRIDANGAAVHNVLLTNCLYGFTGSNSLLHAQQVTANRAGQLINLVGSPAKLTLTNAILVNVTNAGTGTVELDYVATNGTASLPGANHGFTASLSDFQISLGGYHYLATNSTLRDAGTTNIHGTLLGELAALTTYAPVLMKGTAQVAVTMSPQALRDTSQPDLGYHYAPLDYLVQGYYLNTNVVLTMTNGVAVGFDCNTTGYGLLFDTATNLSIGSPTNFNRMVTAHCVQEVSFANSSQTNYMFNDLYGGTTKNSEFRHRFTEFAALANHGAISYTACNWVNWEWSHCWLYNLSFIHNATNSGAGQQIGITNNLIEWGNSVFLKGASSVAYHFRNNLFRNHNLNISNLYYNSTLKDTLFDGVVIVTNGTTISHTHNAFFNCTNLNVYGTNVYATNALPGLTNNLPLASLAYQTAPYGRYGPYGRYYQPSGSILINAGSQNATNAGLYHFASTTNQTKEASSTVDIGLHYIALSSSGDPVDTDGDGLPDFIEDSNSNGGVDSGETNWQDAGDLGLRVFITRPKKGSPLP